MTYQAKFTVSRVSDGPSPIDVEAFASVDDGTLNQNTEKCRSMRLSLVLDVDATSIKVGDVITASGSFKGD